MAAAEEERHFNANARRTHPFTPFDRKKQVSDARESTGANTSQ